MRAVSRTAYCRRVGLLWLGLCWSQAADSAEREAAASPAQPSWRVGDSWVVETLTRRVQGREEQPAGNPPRVRWEFRVTNIEKVDNNDCYRLEVQCLASGRIRPHATAWCDRKTLFLRQFETQLAFNGRYRSVQESYACPKGLTSPVFAFVNALPIAMPAFLPEGAKGDAPFEYVSQPLPSGAKDPSVIRFSHAVKQETQPATSKALESIPPNYAKDLDTKPVVQVKLEDHQRSVVQLWQEDAPWPIYADDGRTQAWLVSTKRP